jgi:hypothetical protein
VTTTHKRRNDKDAEQEAVAVIRQVKCQTKIEVEEEDKNNERWCK